MDAADDAAAVAAGEAVAAAVADPEDVEAHPATVIMASNTRETQKIVINNFGLDMIVHSVKIFC